MLSRPTLSNNSVVYHGPGIVGNYAMKIIALWEDNFYTSPPHVLKPPKTGALVEVVRDNMNGSLHGLPALIPGIPPHAAAVSHYVCTNSAQTHRACTGLPSACCTDITLIPW